MRTIYINGRFLTQPMRGVNRFAYNICKAMAGLEQPFVIVCPSCNVHSDYNISMFQIVHFGIGHSHLWEQIILPFFFIGKRNYLLINLTGLGTILIRQKITTIHDLSFLENPSWFSRSYYRFYRVMTPLAVRTSRHIITVSEFSKNEILRFYPSVKASRVSVVYNAVDTDLFHPMSGASESRYALTVSSIDPRKNFRRLIEAYKGIEGLKLYIVGSHSRVFGEQTGSLDKSCNVKYLGRVSDEELVRLYSQARCFIFPSLYEGFGLPPLEAMACGCPVLASDIPVLREVCGDAAVYFDPRLVNGMYETISQFLNEGQDYMEQLRKNGMENVKRFSMEQSAFAFVQVIRQCV